jgi:GDP-L-fucose synthase
MIRKFHDAVRSGAKAVTLWGDGTPTRELLYVEDCADAMLAALEKYDGAEPVNIGNGVEVRMDSLAGKIAAVTGFKGNIVWDASMPNGQPRRCLDVSKAEALFGWKAKVGLDEGLTKTYEWFKNNK